jgi:hypothetical protein
MTSGNTNLIPAVIAYYYGNELIIIIALFQYLLDRDLTKSISISVQYVACTRNLS